MRSTTHKQWSGNGMVIDDPKNPATKYAFFLSGTLQQPLQNGHCPTGLQYLCHYNYLTTVCNSRLYEHQRRIIESIDLWCGHLLSFHHYIHVHIATPPCRLQCCHTLRNFCISYDWISSLHVNCAHALYA